VPLRSRPATRNENYREDQLMSRSDIELTADDHDLVLLRLTDRPIHDASGLHRAEEADSLPRTPTAQEV
jgi:hypothetical protein